MTSAENRACVVTVVGIPVYNLVYMLMFAIDLTWIFFFLIENINTLDKCYLIQDVTWRNDVTLRLRNGK